MRIILDISRLLASVRHTSPSGIDRVEMAYARRWAGRPEREVTFAAMGLWGGFAAIPRARALALIEHLAEAWALDGAGGERLAVARREALAIHAGILAGRGRSALRQALAARPRPALLLVSHSALERPGPIAAMRRAGAAFVPLIHDLIPLTHPEYSRPHQVPRHGRRIATTAALADGIITNSRATAHSLEPHLRASGRMPPVAVAPLGIALRQPPAADALAGEAPYFLSIGTIEPRKNHLLLLNLWRDMAERLGPATPRLKLLGRRGWENENILRMLERCAPLQGVVEELGPQPDSQVTALLAGARALLFPSFAEGFGLPVIEALALGTPALCSDLPSLREVAGRIPDYLHPLDGAAWREAVEDYAQPDSPRRAAQLARLEGWQAPRWDAHFRRVDSLLEQVLAAPPQTTTQPTVQGAPHAAPAGLPHFPAPTYPGPGFPPGRRPAAAGHARPLLAGSTLAGPGLARHDLADAPLADASLG